MIVECWQHGKLLARHKCSSELTNKEILKRFGLSLAWTVYIHPDGRPDKLRRIQLAEGEG